MIDDKSPNLNIFWVIIILIIFLIIVTFVMPLLHRPVMFYTVDNTTGEYKYEYYRGEK